MNKTALHDMQKTLNIIRNQIEVVGANTKWAALELMLASSASVVALAKKMTKPDTKTVTRKISVPKTKVIKQPSKSTAGDAVQTSINTITRQSRYSINKPVNKRLRNTH